MHAFLSLNLQADYFNAHFRNDKNDTKYNTTHLCCTRPKQPDSSIPCSELPVSISHVKTRTKLPWLGILFHYSIIPRFLIGKWLLLAGLLVYQVGLWPDLSSGVQTTLLSSSFGGPTMLPWLFLQTISHCYHSLGLIPKHCLTPPPQVHVFLLNFIPIYPRATGIPQAP